MNVDPDHKDPSTRDTYTDPGCFIHGFEPIPPDAYRVCGECGHCYNTPEDLVAEDNNVLADMRENADFDLLGYPTHEDMISALGPDLTVDQVDEIHVCPLCIHDF